VAGVDRRRRSGLSPSPGLATLTGRLFPEPTAIHLGRRTAKQWPIKAAACGGRWSVRVAGEKKIKEKKEGGSGEKEEGGTGEMFSGQKG
jgi:hypothetical protein